jgi:exosortase D (VPLPA-CTERM-specific)
MLVKTDKSTQAQSRHRTAIVAGALVSLSILVCVVTFSGALRELIHRWTIQEEYSHGFLIPFIAAWLLWTRRDALRSSVGKPSWVGLGLILFAAVMHVVGKLSAIFLLSQLGFIIALIGVVLGFGGYSLLKVTFVPIIFLIFAIPLPYLIDAALSLRLELISSELGVFFIRIFQIPVFLEGNVIDLGVYKLQVVEACSGLRYLYPLLSLGFLAAYLFHAPFWQRAFVFLSTIPITIFMNSLRIGIVGILVNYWGPQDADGLLHMFEGWIIFVACSGLLILEMYALVRLGSNKSFFDVFYPPQVATGAAPVQNARSFGLAPLATCTLLLCATGLAAYFVTTRHEFYPERKLFAAFPNTLGDWRGKMGSLDQSTAQFLGLTDYILSDYSKKDGHAVNLYIAYYASQRSGVAPHSPSVCIPGNGWQIAKLEETSYASKQLNFALPINRVIVTKGSQKQLVYYWFDERGLQIASEYLSKLYLLRDAIFKNRTDGALVRLTTMIYPNESESDADKRLQEFTNALMPDLAGYLPPASPPAVKPAMNPLQNNRS